MDPGRLAYGWPALLVILFVVSITYIILDPSFTSWYQAGIEMGNTDLTPVLDYLNLLWEIYPIPFLLALIIWGIVMGMGYCPSPGRISLAWLIIISVLIAILLSYITIDPIITYYANISLQISPLYSTALSFVQLIWYAYPYPVTIATIIWAFVQSVSSEQNTYYDY